MSKKCSKCLTVKPLSDFRYQKTRRRYMPQCKVCFGQYLKNRPTKLEEKRKSYYKHRTSIRRRKAQRYQENKPEIDARNQAWKKANRERTRELRRLRMLNPAERLRHAISNHIRLAIKSGKGGRSWEALVGYTLNDLMTHLERLFEPGMTWNNYGFPRDGQRTWSVDHIQAVFHYRIMSVDDPAFRECWALDNLRPLWFEENSSKQHR